MTMRWVELTGWWSEGTRTAGVARKLCKRKTLASIEKFRIEVPQVARGKVHPKNEEPLPRMLARQPACDFEVLAPF